MSIIEKTRKKLAQLIDPILGYDLTAEELDEVNAILMRPRIARISQWDPNSDMNQEIQSATKRVVENYVRGKRNKKQS